VHVCVCVCMCVCIFVCVHACLCVSVLDALVGFLGVCVCVCVCEHVFRVELRTRLYCRGITVCMSRTYSLLELPVDTHTHSLLKSLRHKGGCVLVSWCF